VSSTEATPAEATSQEAQNEEIIDSIYNQDNEMTQSIYEENSVHPTTDPSARAKPTEPSEFTFSAAEKKVFVLLLNLMKKKQIHKIHNSLNLIKAELYWR
jgi:hypothetical protein